MEDFDEGRCSICNGQCEEIWHENKLVEKNMKGRLAICPAHGLTSITHNKWTWDDILGRPTNDEEQPDA